MLLYNGRASVCPIAIRSVAPFCSENFRDASISFRPRPLPRNCFARVRPLISCTVQSGWKFVASVSIASFVKYFFILKPVSVGKLRLTYPINFSLRIRHMKCCPGSSNRPDSCVSYWLSSSEKTVCRRCEISSHKFLMLSDSDNTAALGRWKYTRRSMVTGFHSTS